MKNTLQNIFWIAMIVVVMIIGANHTYDIYLSEKLSEKLEQALDNRNSLDKSYNDGLKYGWEMGLLKVSKIMLVKDLDYSIPFNLSKDSTAYENYLYKVNAK